MKPAACKRQNQDRVPGTAALIDGTGKQEEIFLTLFIVYPFICLLRNKVSVGRLPLNESPMCCSTDFFYACGQRIESKKDYEVTKP
ncbi:MAG: hypothetical protein DMF42_02655 [Verrucomicrobia bacterium]|nr:MAG: hypothetical protein DMF42_02655 [Verrucomicrobiota bacterium]